MKYIEEICLGEEKKRNTRRWDCRGLIFRLFFFFYPPQDTDGRHRAIKFQLPSSDALTKRLFTSCRKPTPPRERRRISRKTRERCRL